MKTSVELLFKKEIHGLRAKSLPFKAKQHQSDLEELFNFHILKCSTIPVPEREYKFHPTRRWRSDFAWPKEKLLVEIEGGIWSRGRHVQPAGYENDCEKYNEATLLGYSILHLTPKHVKNGVGLTWVEKFFKEK